MATNYTIKEAVKIVAEGKDLEKLADIGKRFPILAHKIAVVAAKAGEDFIGLMNFMPDYLTANKVNTAIKAVISGTSTESDEDTNDETSEETTESNGTDYESMSGKELWALVGKLGIRKSAKSNKKTDLIEALKAYDAGKIEGADEDVDDDEDVDESTGSYEGKSAMELFKECKKRGLKAAPKKPAKFYIELLEADDVKANEEVEEADDWGDEEVEETSAPKKEKKATEKKSTKKAKVEEEDEDDDWDI